MKRKIATAAALLSIAALAACSSQPGNAGGGDNSSEAYSWDMSITTSETSAWWAGAERFTEILADKSDGRLAVTVFANETLSSGDTSAGIEQLMEGTKALSYTSAIQYSSFDDRFSAIAAPFLFANYEEVDAVLTDPEVQQAYSDLLEEMGIKFLGFAENGFRHFSSNVTEVREPSDLAGQKLRVPGSPLSLDIFNAFGSDPVVMSFNELFTSLQTGTVDGHENSIDLIQSGGLDEVTEYLTLSNYVFDPLILSMNLELYNSLNAADQQIINDAAQFANEYEIEFIREREAEQLKEIEQNISVTRLSEKELAEFREFVQPIYESWDAKWTPELAALVQPNSDGA